MNPKDVTWWERLDPMGLHERMRVMRLAGFTPPQAEGRFWAWYKQKAAKLCPAYIPKPPQGCWHEVRFESDRARWEAASRQRLQDVIDAAVREACAAYERQRRGPRVTSPADALRYFPLFAAAARLGLPTPPFELTVDQVNRAWRTKAAKHHPDRGGDEAEFIACTKARDELKAYLESAHG